MASVYLETSFVSACVTERTDHASAYRREVSQEWWTTQRPKHELSISEEVLAELSHPGYPGREDALAVIREVPLLPITDEIRGLARLFVNEKVMPGPVVGDAIHVAVATFHALEFLLTWNVRHLANPNKTDHLQKVCMRVGVAPPRIVTPDLLWEIDDA
jgi:hypothetical protein